MGIGNPFEGLDEAIAGVLLDFVIWAAIGSWNLIETAFEYTDITSDDNQGLWAAVIGGDLIYTTEEGGSATVVSHPGLLNIMVGAMIPVLVIFVGLQLITSIVKKSSAGFLRAAVMTVAAIPSVYITAGLMWFAMAATSSLTRWILGVGTTDSSGDTADVADGPRAIVGLFGLHFVSEDTDETIVADPETGLVLDENAAHFSAGGSVMSNAGVTLGALVVIGLLLFSALFLALMMGFRMVVLLLMASFTPVAIFALTWEAAKPVAIKWLQVSVALLLAEPVAAVVMRLGAAIGMFGQSWVNVAMGLCVLVVAGLMPLATMAMVSFMTGGSSDQIDRTGVGIGAGVGGVGAAIAGKGASKAGAAMKRPHGRA